MVKTKENRTVKIVKHCRTMSFNFLDANNECCVYNMNKLIKINLQTVFYNPNSIQLVSAASRGILIKGEIITITVHVA